MKFAMEHQNPLVTGAIISKDAGATAQPATAPGEYPADSYSLLSVSNPNVLLWALKPAEEGIDQGVIARFWNLADAPADGLLSFTPKMSLGIRTTHIETDLEAVPLTVEGRMPIKFARQQLQTYRLRPRHPVGAADQDADCRRARGVCPAHPFRQDTQICPDRHLLPPRRLRSGLRCVESHQPQTHRRHEEASTEAGPRSTLQGPGGRSRTFRSDYHGTDCGVHFRADVESGAAPCRDQPFVQD